MIECTHNVNRKAFVRARANAPRIQRIAPNQFRVAGHAGSYLVTFTRRRKAYLATCINEDTGNVCPANDKGRWCYHVAASLIQMVEANRRTEGAA